MCEKIEVNEERLYTTNDLCKHFNLSRMTIERLRKLGLPYIKKGRNVYFIMEDVQKWMENHNKIVKFNYKN